MLKKKYEKTSSRPVRKPVLAETKFLFLSFFLSTSVSALFCSVWVLRNLDNLLKIFSGSQNRQVFFAWFTTMTVCTGSFSKDFFSQGAVSQVFLGLFISFCTNSIVKYGRNFILVLLNHTIKKKVEKSRSQKRLNFRVGSKWHIFHCLIFSAFCP